ncbi:hypothetical protein C1645_833403 [Glomus cerebriforme]|uniref:Uncharacterized protein n=1 Tax=Glomus cerebriforme TaxID=658196 RepID=A0A397SI90_9GLOM|nr:hypothetical protein C1645_833403 [Glomus cerebriforme]
MSLYIGDDNNLVIIQGNAGVCPGESARDTIDDLCQIIEKWQDEVTTMYNQNLPRDRNLGNVTFEEVEKMVVYKNIRNNIAHKSKWNSGRNREKYEEALECINRATCTNAYINKDKK